MFHRELEKKKIKLNTKLLGERDKILVGYLSSTREASLVAQRLKHLPAIWETPGLIPGLGRSPGEGNGNPLQHCSLEIHGWRCLEDYSPWGCKESDTTGQLHFLSFFLSLNSDIGGQPKASWRVLFTTKETVRKVKKMAFRMGENNSKRRNRQRSNLKNTQATLAD